MDYLKQSLTNYFSVCFELFNPVVQDITIVLVIGSVLY